MSYAYEVGDLVIAIFSSIHSRDREYGMGVIVDINYTEHGTHTYLVSFPQKGFRQWRGHNELRKLQ
jgi:hypothetical protein